MDSPEDIPNRIFYKSINNNHPPHEPQKVGADHLAKFISEKGVNYLFYNDLSDPIKNPCHLV